MGQPIDGTSLVAYYKFDEASGNLINVASRITNNSTLGSAADGTNSNITYGQVGKIGKSYNYNGSTSHTTLGSSVSQFNFMHNTTMKFTVALWIKRADTTGEVIYNDTRNTGADIGNGFGTNSSNRLSWLFINGATVTEFDSANNILPADTNWHFVVLTVDWSLASNNIMMQVDNGTAQFFNKSGSPSNSNSSFAMEIGDLAANNGAFWNGNLDEFSIWNRVLTTSELTILWNNGIGIALDSQYVTLSDALSTVESVTKLIAKSISDSISLSSDTVNKSINKAISDTLGISDSVHISRVVKSVSDGIITNDTVSISKNIIRTVVDNLSAGDIISKSLGKQINDSPSLSDVLGKNINKILADNLSLVDIISKSITKLIVENPSFLDSTGQSRTLVRQITDALSTLESTVISKDITKQIIDNLSSGDSMSKNIGKLLQDNPTLAEQLSKAIGKIITDNISIPDSVTKNIGSLLLNQTRRINLNNTTQQTIAEGKPRNVTI